MSVITILDQLKANVPSYIFFLMFNLLLIIIFFPMRIL